MIPQYKLHDALTKETVSAGTTTSLWRSFNVTPIPMNPDESHIVCAVTIIFNNCTYVCSSDDVVHLLLCLFFELGTYLMQQPFHPISHSIRCNGRIIFYHFQTLQCNE